MLRRMSNRSAAAAFDTWLLHVHAESDRRAEDQRRREVCGV